MTEDIRDIVDKRNQVSNELYTKPDTEAFIFNDYCLETEEMAKSINYIDGIFRVRLILIARLIGAGDYEEAFDSISALSSEYTIEELSLVNQMKYYGVLVIYYGDFKAQLGLAIKYSQKEMKLAEEIGDLNEVMRIKMNIGSLNIELGFDKTAIDFINEACDYYESIKNFRLLTYCYVNLGEAYHSLKKDKEAKSYLIKAIDLANQENEINIKYGAIHLLGLIAEDAKEYNKALDYYKEAIKMSEESQRINKDFSINLDLVKLYLNTNEFDYALHEIKAVEIELLNSKKSVIKRFYKYKAQVYEKLEDFSNAYMALNKYLLLVEDNDTSKKHKEMNSLIQEEYSKTINRLETIAMVGRELTILSDIDEVILRVRKELVKVLEVDVIGIGEIIGSELCFNHYFVGTEKVKAKNVPLNKKSSLATWSISNKKEVIINDLEKESIKYISTVNRIKGRHSKDDDTVKSLMYAPLKVNDETIGVLTVQSVHKDAYTSVEVNIFKIITDYVSIALKNVNQRLALEALSERDILTKMYNRRGFIDFFDQFISNTNREHLSVGIIMLDLDFFKAVNDTYGHLAGDELLIVIGEYLMDKESKDIRAGRLGGEEFALIVLNKEENYLIQLANEIRIGIGELCILAKNTKVSVTTSVGVSYSKEPLRIEYNQLYYEADRALYFAKENGRNTVKSFKI